MTAQYVVVSDNPRLRLSPLMGGTPCSRKDSWISHLIFFVFVFRFFFIYCILCIFRYHLSYCSLFVLIILSLLSFVLISRFFFLFVVLVFRYFSHYHFFYCSLIFVAGAEARLLYCLYHGSRTSLFYLYITEFSRTLLLVQFFYYFVLFVIHISTFRNKYFYFGSSHLIVPFLIKFAFRMRRLLLGSDAFVLVHAVYTYIYISLSLYIYTYIYIYIDTHVYIYIYIYIHIFIFCVSSLFVLLLFLHDIPFIFFSYASFITFDLMDPPPLMFVLAGRGARSYVGAGVPRSSQRYLGF